MRYIEFYAVFYATGVSVTAPSKTLYLIEVDNSYKLIGGYLQIEEQKTWCEREALIN